MVYCGKASQGCQSCRTRRIKLATLFPSQSQSHPVLTSTATPPSTTVATKGRRSSGGKRLAKEIIATPVDKAIQFYVEHYVLGLPDEPRAGHELRGIKWVHSRETRDIMAAVGMASLSNLTGDKEMNTLAKHHYGLALQNMASSVRNMASVDIDLVLRAVVMMAMYEVIRDRNEPASLARTHVMGGAAILSNSLPLPQAPADGPRGLLQLCFSMVASKQSSLQYSSPEPNVLIPTHIEPQSEGVLPETFFDWLSIIDKTVSEPDRPSAELLKVMARFVQLSAPVRSQPLIDGHPKTADVIREALEINRDLESWEKRQDGIWAVVEEHVDKFFPHEAVFDGCYHIYDNTYIARVWNHYRWAHTMVNQLLLESVTKYPVSSAPLVSTDQQRHSLACIRHLARDTLVSVPTHYRHPTLGPAHWDHFDKTKRGAVIGIAGIPTLLFEIKVAGCAPGVPERCRAWALNMLETAYRDTGMFQAKALAGFLGKMVERESSPSLSPESVGEGGGG
ncbi:hypothetical protein C8A01DRAFT_20939 [Parachaetomium inaequale]|uniref:Uncharacterized protein n=1 Tax=Parachaetomium inaequale TaxID=2588326 RepID=A0AAN6SLP0_9PEZI|nr:hypothetical protein C8A01DRAFT_20939 [Parachaetomium inaequale]